MTNCLQITQITSHTRQKTKIPKMTVPQRRAQTGHSSTALPKKQLGAGQCESPATARRNLLFQKATCHLSNAPSSRVGLDSPRSLWKRGKVKILSLAFGGRHLQVGLPADPHLHLHITHSPVPLGDVCVQSPFVQAAKSPTHQRSLAKMHFKVHY